jgi:hypothetical protein
MNTQDPRWKAASPDSVPNAHQLKILRDTVKNPLKGKFLGGPSAEEAEEILRAKFRYTDKDIQKLKKSAAASMTPEVRPYWSRWLMGLVSMKQLVVGSRGVSFT